MKSILVIGMVAAALAVGAPKAEASMVVVLQSGVQTLSCDNSTAAGVTACTTAGFTTLLGANAIGFGQLPSGFAGYTFGIGSGAVSNAPGGVIAFTSDTKLNATNVSATADLTVTWAALGFTSPAGPFLTLSSSMTANWALDAFVDTSGFTGFARADNGTTTIGATQTAVSPVCTSPANSTTFSCSTQSGDVTWLRGAGPFSLLGQETIHLGLGDIGSFSGQVVAGQSSVPEPASMLLLGTGLVGLAAMARRRARKA